MLFSENKGADQLCGAVTAQLAQLICVFVFAHEKSRFSRDADCIIYLVKTKELISFAVPLFLHMQKVNFLMTRLIKFNCFRYNFLEMSCRFLR